MEKAGEGGGGWERVAGSRGCPLLAGYPGSPPRPNLRLPGQTSPKEASEKRQ